VIEQKPKLLCFGLGEWKNKAMLDPEKNLLYSGNNSSHMKV